LPNAFGIVEHVNRRKANDMPSFLFHHRSTTSVRLYLMSMMLTVDFDDDLFDTQAKSAK